MPVSKMREFLAVFVELLIHHTNVWSLHGFKKFFIVRSQVMKRLWVVAILFSLSICSYYLVQTAREHLIEKPIVTSLEYVHLDQFDFPAFRLCPSLFSHEVYFNRIFNQTRHRDLIFIILMISFNPMFKDLRYHLDKDFNTTFQKYNTLETLWQNYVRSAGLFGYMHYFGKPEGGKC